jgi:hypothetical protein
MSVLIEDNFSTDLIKKIPKNDKRYKILSKIPPIKNCFVKFRKKKNNYFSYDFQLFINDDNTEYKYVFFKSSKEYDENNIKYIDLQVIGRYTLQ